MTFESVHNYYERLVFEDIRRQVKKNKLKADEDFLEDVACVALNRLPARYVRHHVDLAFYLTAEEHQAIAAAVREAVSGAVTFVEQRRR